MISKNGRGWGFVTLLEKEKRKSSCDPLDSRIGSTSPPADTAGLSSASSGSVRARSLTLEWDHPPGAGVSGSSTEVIL